MKQPNVLHTFDFQLVRIVVAFNEVNRNISTKSSCIR